MKHPLTITGTAILAGSWAFLLFGSGADEFRSIVNLHKLAIAHAGIISGLGLIVTGQIADGFNTVLPSSTQPGILSESAPDAGPQRERTMTPEELTKALAEARAKLSG